MIRPPSLRSTVTTLAAAAVLVGGADLASYAATGSPLVLGHANATAGTTSIANAGHGPALSLTSGKGVAPLVVSSSTLVKHLNAAELAGRSAGQLEPKVWRYTLGKDGKRLSLGLHFFTTSLPSGTYQVQMSGVLSSSGAAADSYACAIGDKKKIVANNLTGLFTFGVGTYQTSPAVSDSYLTNISKKRPVLLGCNTDSTSDGTGKVTVVKALQFTFRAITVKDKRGKPYTPAPRGAQGHSLLLR
jgi:hypothetical protein